MLIEGSGGEDLLKVFDSFDSALVVSVSACPLEAADVSVSSLSFLTGKSKMSLTLKPIACLNVSILEDSDIFVDCDLPEQQPADTLFRVTI